MRVSRAAICVASLSSWALAAPIAISLPEAQKQPVISASPITSQFTIPPGGQRLRKPPVADVASQSEPQDAWDPRPNNQPYTPSDDVAPSVALSSPRPLKTTYLLSLLRPQASDTEADVSVPQLGSGAHQAERLSRNNPEAQHSSIVREEAGTAKHPPYQPTTVELETEGNKAVYQIMPCTMADGSRYIYVVRRYSDTSVVGLLLVLLAIVAAFEFWGAFCGLARMMGVRGRGRIRLGDEIIPEDDEKTSFRSYYADFGSLPPISKVTYQPTESLMDERMAAAEQTNTDTI